MIPLLAIIWGWTESPFHSVEAISPVPSFHPRGCTKCNADCCAPPSPLPFPASASDKCPSAQCETHSSAFKMPIMNHADGGYWNKEFSNSKPMNSPKFSPYSSRESSPPYPSSPTSISPLSSSPPLRRAFSNSFPFIPEDRAVDQPIMPPTFQRRTASNEARFIRMIFWWPLFFVGFMQLVYQYLKSNFKQALMLLSPRFWFSTLWYMFHRLLHLPIVMLNEALARLHSDSAERNRRKRTVLISSGSSIQTLHLARNFYSSGTRVVVCDYHGLFPLSKFSTTISRYYTVPNPATSSVNDYITAICEIVIAENVTFYVPTCVTTASYFDALVKPHLELLGCQSFIAGIHELAVLDDILETLERCRANHVPVPNYRAVESKEELLALYDSGWMSGFQNMIISSVGHLGRVERKKIKLPAHKRDLKFPHEISDKRPWVVIHDDLTAAHYITCTTVKDNKVVANVTCLVQSNTKNMIPELNEEIEKWLKEFFNANRFQRPINGHFTFRLMKAADNILPVGIRAGVSLPYLCHTSAQTKLLWKSCPHFTRANSGPLVQSKGRYWIHDMFLKTLRHPSVESLTNLIGTVLDKREALFLYWDPLPYCAYYHYHLPLVSVREFLQKFRQRKNHNNRE